MHHGTVKWFDYEKGYGFISRDDSSVDMFKFVHYSGINTDGYRVLMDGDTVQFDIGTCEKGPCAVNVKKFEQFYTRIQSGML